MTIDGEYASADEYMEALPADRRIVMEQLRSTIRAAAPDATEAIAYNMPAFGWDGRFLVSHGGFKRHYSLFPWTDDMLAELGADLQPYAVGKGVDATYPGWNIRRGHRHGTPHYRPATSSSPATEEAAMTGDPRIPVAARDAKAYQGTIRAAAEHFAVERFMWTKTSPVPARPQQGGTPHSTTGNCRTIDSRTVTTHTNVHPDAVPVRGRHPAGQGWCRRVLSGPGRIDPEHAGT